MKKNKENKQEYLTRAWEKNGEYVFKIFKNIGVLAEFQ